MQLRVAAVVDSTESEGPHRRAAIWVQGCSLRCPGCCNPEMFDPHAGATLEIDPLLDRLQGAASQHDLEGITILGGEPLDQLEPVAALAQGARRLGLGVLVFSGYRLEEARARPGFATLWRHLDTIVDGRFDARRPEPRSGRRYVGSHDQRILHRTLRYAAPSLWRGPATAEVEIAANGSVTVTGFPIEVRRLVRGLRTW